VLLLLGRTMTEGQGDPPQRSQPKTGTVSGSPAHTSCCQTRKRIFFTLSWEPSVCIQELLHRTTIVSTYIKSKKPFVSTKLQWCKSVVSTSFLMPKV